MIITKMGAAYSEYKDETYGPSIHLAVLALEYRLMRQGFNVEVKPHRYPRDVISGIYKHFENLTIQWESIWNFELSGKIFSGKFISRKGITLVHYTEDDTIIGFGPSLEFALISLFAEIIYHDRNKTDTLILKEFLLTIPYHQNLSDDVTFVMGTATRIGSGPYKAVFTSKEVSGMTIYSAKISNQ